MLPPLLRPACMATSAFYAEAGTHGTCCTLLILVWMVLPVFTLEYAGLCKAAAGFVCHYEPKLANQWKFALRPHRSSLAMVKKKMTFRAPNDPRQFLWNITWPEEHPKVQIMARKIQMTQIFSPDGICEPVTVLEILPGCVCHFSEFGFAQISCGKLIENHCWNKRPYLGRISKIWANGSKIVSSKLQPPQNFVLGQILDIGYLLNATHLSVTGIGKGKGFGGTVTRHGFKRGPMSHGSRHHRAPGSIGAGTTPGRVFKNKKMPGRYGNKQSTFHGLKILAINPIKNLVLLKGSVPGNRNAIITLTRDEFGIENRIAKA